MRYLFLFILFLCIVIIALNVGYTEKYTEMPVFKEQKAKRVIHHYLTDSYYRLKQPTKGCVEFYGFYGLAEARDFVLYLRWFDLSGVIQSDPFAVDVRVALFDKDAKLFADAPLSIYYSYTNYYPNIVYSGYRELSECSRMAL